MQSPGLFRAAADQIAVAVAVVDLRYVGEEFRLADEVEREHRLFARVGMRDHSPQISAAVWGAFTTTLSASPEAAASSHSRLIWMSVAMKRSISAFGSDSVGSTISVSCTGKESVGAWKP